MIPAIEQTSPVQGLYLAFINALQKSGFKGDICPDYANRTVLATDNSIYQVLPQGVIYPKDSSDIAILTSLSNQTEYHSIVLSPRGGGTGTNGQSLTDGLVVDTSKYMNQILEINAEEGWARVQCGVVKDQLNAAIKPHGLFFAPELSTSNRATIGGMINTDASGQGSCTYGKTRDHVLELTTVLMDGSTLTTKPLDDDALVAAKNDDTRASDVVRLVENIHAEYTQEISNTFPPLNRCLTGYDLAHIRTERGELDLNSILCGSEGTLGFICEAKLNLLPIPKVTALINVQYADFNSALRDAKTILDAKPNSIETIDSRVFNLAKGDIIWESVKDFFPDIAGQSPEGINFVEYVADSDSELDAQMQPLLDMLNHHEEKLSLGYSIIRNDDVGKIWGMRKKAVGLLGNTQGEARPMAFVEDTAVPPEHLADFIEEFRALLDSLDLQYGMFGHVDAGVLHVRPILDMKVDTDAKLVRTITDQVVALTHKYNGLLWGEHGKGFRSEFAPKFFGVLYPLLQQIKYVFDPHNQLNPGKIATINDAIPLTKIDEVKTRGDYDKTIDSNSWQQYQEGMFCNGNGACHNWNPDDAMCPSWKGTRNRTYTPKARASLIREWLRQLNERGTSAHQESQRLHQQNVLQQVIAWPKKIKHSWDKHQGHYDFSHEVQDSMSACLACKSCTGSCPIKVDVPEFRSKFLELYHSRYLRPLKDYFVGTLEFIVPTAARYPAIYNGVMGSGWVRSLLEKTAGLKDSPLLSRIDFKQALAERDIPEANEASITALDSAQKDKAVIIVLDAFTRYFETELVLDTLDLLKALGFTPLVAPFLPNGKPLHVHGFRKSFTKVATKTSRALNQLSISGIPLVGIEPSMTLAYRGEYRKVLGEFAPTVLLIQEWLAKQDLLTNTSNNHSKRYKLLGHCTEKTNAAPAINDWKTVFAHLGLTLETVNVGCCGMAGTFGHESKNYETSKTIYSQSWKAVIDGEDHAQLVATGYSCRSQVKRESAANIANPIQALLKAIS